jgi:dihydroorotate dehydrogenase electron transfer subunit
MLSPTERVFLLPRPFSVMSVRSGKDGALLECLYTRVGAGTMFLEDLGPGDAMRVVGPLGRGFDLSLPGRAVLVGGGRGVAPLVHLASALAGVGRAATALLGARTADLVYGAGRLAGAAVRVSTEDGSEGTRGVVTDLLAGELARGPAAVYACGPHGMLARVAAIAEDAGAPCEVSIEAHMACGTGVCRGCAVGVRDEARPYRMVCSDGPVFDARALRWDTLAEAH